jgi:DNA transformation protein
MPSSQSFVDHVLDLLSLLGPVEARRMFGGHGLYAGGAMFGLLDDDELFLKTDAETRAHFAEAGCRMWVYREMRETSYFRPPDEAHEDPTAMLPWARLALDAALRGQAAAAARSAARERRDRSGAPARAKAARGARSGAAPEERKKGGAGRKPATVSVRGAGKATPGGRRSPRAAKVQRTRPSRSR